MLNGQLKTVLQISPHVKNQRAVKHQCIISLPRRGGCGGLELQPVFAELVWKNIRKQDEYTTWPAVTCTGVQKHDASCKVKDGSLRPDQTLEGIVPESQQ